MLEGKLTLKLQLILAVTVPCLALLLVGGASLKSMGTIQQQSTELYQNTATPMRALVMSVSERSSAPVGQTLTQGMSSHISQGISRAVKYGVPVATGSPRSASFSVW